MLKTKNLLITCILLSVSTWFFSFNAQAQGEKMYKKYALCKVVINSGDTILGKIKPQGQYLNKIKLRIGNKKTSIRLENIDYMLVNMIRYKRVNIFGSNKLLELVAYGHYDLYAYKRYKGQRINIFYFLDAGEGELIQLNPSNYKSICQSYIDDPEILEKIEDEVWNYEQLTRAFRYYNVIKSRETDN